MTPDRQPNLGHRQFSRRATLALAGAAAIAITAASPALANVTETFSKHVETSEVTVDHSAWNTILNTYITRDANGLNRVDYGAIKNAALDDLKGYVESLEATDPTKLNRAEQWAYWANLYNAKTLEVVVDNYPVGSIREITINEGLFGFLKKSAGLGGPWKAKIIEVNGQELSLDDVEHEIMRKVFKDPRVHYSVNCASVGCPNLLDEAFTGAKLEGQLDRGARDFINTPRGIEVKGDGSVVASSIYSWFQVDFGGTEEGVLEHVRKYAEADLKSKLEGKTDIASFQYDWNLNDVSKTN